MPRNSISGKPNNAKPRRKSTMKRGSSAAAIQDAEVLRRGLTERVYKQSGNSPATASREIQQFVDESVTHMMRSGNFSNNDIARVAQLAKAMHETEIRQPPISPPLVKQQIGSAVLGSPKTAHVQSPSGAAAATAPTGGFNPASSALRPRPPSEAEQHRATVVGRYNRLKQDEAWAKRVEEENSRFRTEQQLIQEKRRKEMDIQKDILKRQMEEAQRRKVDEKSARRSDMEKFLEEQRIKEEEQRKREEELKAVSKEKRREIETYMKDRVRERHEMIKQQKEQDRIYLNKIIEEEKEKKRLEKQKKDLSRQELLQFLSGNVANVEVVKKKEAEQREKDRLAMLDRQARQERQAADAEAERLRKDEKGQRLMERAARIQREYDERVTIERELARQKDQRDGAKLKAKEQEERQRELDRQRLRDANKARMVSELEAQIEDKQRQKREDAAKDASFRSKIQTAIQLGTASEQEQKLKLAESKAATMKALEAQIKDKNRRERTLGLPCKIGHDY